MAENTLTVEQTREIFGAANCLGAVALIDYLMFEKAEGVMSTKAMGFECDPRPVSKRGCSRDVRPKNKNFSLGGSGRTPFDDLAEIANSIPDIDSEKLKAFDDECAAFAQALADIELEAGHA